MSHVVRSVKGVTLQGVRGGLLDTVKVKASHAGLSCTRGGFQWQAIQALRRRTNPFVIVVLQRGTCHYTVGSVQDTQVWA